jgi:integrase
MAKLTVRSIEKTAPSDKDVILWDDELKGFGLKVTPKGKRSFFLYYRTLERVQRKPHIGDYPAMRPEQARVIAKDWLSEVRLGRDPSGDRKSRRAMREEDTVAQLFDTYKKAKEHLRSIGEIERIFRHDILPVIGAYRAETVSRAQVTRLLDDIAKRSPAAAQAVRRQLSAFYTWALPRLPDRVNNPVKNAGKIRPLAKRDRVLSVSEVGTLWRVLENEVEPWRSALKLLLLTGQRRNEVLKADWSEFDLAVGTWTIPAVRAKNGVKHRIPLVPSVIAVLEALPGRSGRLFKSGTGPASRAALRIRNAMGDDVPPWRWHDIRRTVATGLQRLGVRLEVTEAILNHTSGSRAGIVGVYQQHDWAAEKALALEAWATELERIVAQRTES